jgi:hypothetical protein
VLAHLHTRAPAPAAYIKYVFYERFGWTPDELRAIPLAELEELLTVMAADAQYQNRPKGKTAEKAKTA